MAHRDEKKVINPRREQQVDLSAQALPKPPGPSARAVEGPPEQLPRVEHPILESLRLLWEAKPGLTREELTSRFQSILEEAHKAESLGSYEANSALCKWVNAFAKKNRYRLLMDGEAVTLSCMNRKTGYFVPRHGDITYRSVVGSSSFSFPRLTAISLSNKV